MSSKFRSTALIVNFCFIVGLIFAIFLRDGKYHTALYFFLGVFLILFFSQCFVWNIRKTGHGFILSRLAFQRVKLTYDDIRDVGVEYIAYRLSGSEKDDETISLKTTKGTFRFRGDDYMIFTEVRDALLGTPELKERYHSNRATAERKSDPLWKLKDYLVYIGLAIVIVVFIGLLKSR